MARITKRLLRGPQVAVRGIWAIASGFPLRFVEIVGQMFPENAWGCRIRGTCYRPFLKKCGRNFQIGLQAKLEHLDQIEVGDDVYVGHGAWISGLRGGVVLDDEVMLGPFVAMVSSNHTFHHGSARFAEGKGGRIEIGAGTWIAAHVTVTAGVTVGRSCLIAAGGVVTKSIPAGSIAAGVPAKVIGRTSQPKQETDAEKLKC